MSETLAIAINSRVRDIIHRRNMVAVDDFSMAFAIEAARLIETNVPLDGAIEQAIRKTGRRFATMNGDRMQRFTTELAGRLAFVVPAQRSLLDILHEFKKYAERQLVGGFKKNRNEEFCRSNLQTYLEQAGRTTREVQSGGGLIDVVVESGEPVEAKLWRGHEYFAGGIEELSAYMRTEGQSVGYYVVFDILSDNLKLRDEDELQVAEGRIHQLGVRMNPGQPSKLRRRRHR